MMQRRVQIMGIVSLLGLSLAPAEAEVSTTPATTPEHVKALSSVRAFPALTTHYLQPIPKPGGGPGQSISFRKVVLGADFNQPQEMICAGGSFRKPRSYHAFDYTSAIEPWFHPESLKTGFVTTFRRAGYLTIPREEPLFEESPAEVGSLQIGARIINLSGGVCIETRQVYEFQGYEGKPEQVWLERVVDVIGKLSVEWQVFDTAQSRVVYRSTTRGTQHEGDSLTASLSAAMHGAFQEATKNLLSDRRFYKLVHGDLADGLEGGSDPIGIDNALLDSEQPLKSKTAMKSLVSIKTDKGEAEGFVLSADGYLLTTATNLAGYREVDVKIGSSRKRLKGTVVRIAPASDVALIRVIPDKSLVPLPLRRAPAVEGEKVFILSDGRGTRRRSGSLVAIQDGGPGHQVLIADMRHRNKAHGTPLLDSNGNVLGVKIRDFLDEETTRKASRYLTIHDALQALRVHVLG